MEQLLGGYLHQDRPMDYTTVWDAVEDFCAREGTARARQARIELNELIAEGHTEHELRKLVGDDLGCSYWPPADGSTFGKWRDALQARLP